jgi:G:T-mismatch repair DNA endonuclease (very short patch repair protein)
VTKTAKEIWKYDEDRVNYIISKGYCVIIIWEIDWFKNKEYRENKKQEILNAICENKIIKKNR